MNVRRACVATPSLKRDGAATAANRTSVETSTSSTHATRASTRRGSEVLCSWPLKKTCLRSGVRSDRHGRTPDETSATEGRGCNQRHLGRQEVHLRAWLR